MFGSLACGIAESSLSSPTGLTFAAHPQVLASPVRVFFFLNKDSSFLWGGRSSPLLQIYSSLAFQNAKPEYGDTGGHDNLSDLA